MNENITHIKTFNNYYRFCDYNLVGVSCMVDVVQARTHKNKRINKKWRKRYGTKEVPWNKVYINGKDIYCHPSMIEKMKECDNV